MATGILEGAIASQLLTSLLGTIKKYHDSKETLLGLQERLQRLEPLVKSLQRLAFDGSVNPQAARNWLTDLNRVLTKAQDLVLDSQGNIKRVLHALELDKIDSQISRLLIDSFAIQLLEQIEARGQLRELITNQGSYVREGGIKRVVGQLRRLHTGGNTGDGFSSSTNPSSWNSRWDRILVVPEAPQVTFGGEAVAEEQIAEILHGEYRKWIVMWGMGGVGKTCTALKLYHNDSIQQHFTGGTYWVTISKDQAPPVQVLRLVYEKVTGTTASNFPEELQAAKGMVKCQLDREKVLLVLDDVWAAQTLQALDVISESRKGVLLTTTRDKGILNFEAVDEGAIVRLRRIAESARVVEIRPLSKEDSWRLFSYHAFEVYGKPMPDELTPLRLIAEDVAEECKGLPLALKVIGSTMDGATYLSHEDLRLGRTAEIEWKKALEELRKASKEGVRRKIIERHWTGGIHDNEDASLYDRLQWSLDTLGNYILLEDCFSYFVAYPEDFSIPVRDLLQMWVAEGLCRGEEEEGVELLGILTAKSMVELAADGQTCKIHDVMRDLLRLNVKYDADSIIPASARTCLCEPRLNLSAFPSDWTSSGVLSAKRLSIRNNRLRKLPDRLLAPHLTVLILSWTSLTSLPPGFFATLSNLRVLDLSGTDIKNIPGSVLENLKSLVLLDLRTCTDLRKISNKLNNLKQLEILLLSNTNDLRKLPRMTGLTKLHTLSYINRFLSRTGCLLGRTMVGSATRDVFQLHGLRRLEIEARYVQDDVYPQISEISSLAALEELKLDGFRNFPAGLLVLHRLKVLKIKHLLAGTLPSLDELPCLQELSIVQCDDLNAFPESFGRAGAFPSLKKFRICDVSVASGELFRFQAGTMPKIQMLLLMVRPPIEFPTWIAELSTLKILRLVDLEDQRRELETLFRRANCFPNLEHLGVSSISGVPGLPSHLLERQREGRLKIETVSELDCRREDDDFW